MTSWILLAINFNAIVLLLFMISYRNFPEALDMPVLLHSLVFTFLQAALSALVCLVVGVICAPGYARFGRKRRALRWLFLLPNFMSPVLAVLALLLTFQKFPFGLLGIILGHIFLNGGLATVWIGERYIEIMERWGPVNAVLGGGAPHFFFKVALPQLRAQLVNTFAVLFSFCLASFAVPLVLGGGPQNSTLEVLIYERIFTDADIGGAIVLSLIQSGVQFTVFFALLKPILLKTEYSKFAWAPPTFGAVAVVPLLFGALCAAPLVNLVLVAAPEFSHMSAFTSSGFLEAAKTSLLTSLIVATISFALLCVVTVKGWGDLIISMPALSGISIGLAGLLIFKTWHMHSLLLFSLSLAWGHLSVMTLPLLRLCAPSLGPLRLKFEKVIQQVGAEPWFTLKNIYLPLGSRTLVAGSVLAGCWSIGEFSVSSMMSPRASTLPVYIHSLLGSYRLEAAAGAAVILLILSVLTMTLFEVLAHGLG